MRCFSDKQTQNIDVARYHVLQGLKRLIKELVEPANYAIKSLAVEKLVRLFIFAAWRLHCKLDVFEKRVQNLGEDLSPES